jgi:hypothetical protein
MSKLTIENYCFSQLETYNRKNFEIFTGWDKNLTALYRSFHEIDQFNDYRIFSILRENIVDYFRFSGLLDFKKNIVFLSKTKIQPAIGYFYEMAALPKQPGKKNFKEAVIIGNLFCVHKSEIYSSTKKTVLCAVEKPEVIDSKKKRQFELIPSLFCFHTRDKVKQILTFTGVPQDDATE